MRQVWQWAHVLQVVRNWLDVGFEGFFSVGVSVSNAGCRPKQMLQWAYFRDSINLESWLVVIGNVGSSVEEKFLVFLIPNNVGIRELKFEGILNFG